MFASPASFVTVASVALLLANGRRGAVADIPVPTPAQLRYQQHEIAALVHFGMETFGCAKGTGYYGCRSCWNASCPGVPGLGRNPATFNPTQLDTDNWASSMKALGARHAVLTAKHDAGFLLFPTNVSLPDGSPYAYCVGAEGAAIQTDVLRQFVGSMVSHGIGHGFYYSVGNNVYLNVNNGEVMPWNGTNKGDKWVGLLPGQAVRAVSPVPSDGRMLTREGWSADT
jgi:hypothetical protein